MKILCFIDVLGSGGAQRQLVNLGIEFKSIGVDISFLVYYPNTFYASVLAENNIEVHLIYETRIIPRIHKIRNYIRNGSFDAVISFLETPNLIAELAGFPIRKWKLLVGERSSNPRISKSYKLKFLRFMHLFADAVISNSESNLEIVKKVNPFLSKNRCHTIYNMVDLDIWKPSEDYIVKKNGKINIVIAASHQYLKNSRNLIEAINLLSDIEKASLSVKWFGAKSPDNSFNESQLLIDKYKLNGIIEFLPEVSNISEKMNESDCCALFSLYEGLPNAICEGMAIAKPIIATNVSDVQKLIDEGMGGYLCETPSIESIKKIITKIIYCPNEQLIAMGNYNREKAILIFNKANIINRYLKILQNA